MPLVILLLHINENCNLFIIKFLQCIAYIFQHRKGAGYHVIFSIIKTKTNFEAI